ncbi:hypothetical protein CSB09_04625 [Candidatus Gracilibacteria bacterium]|nr:MAG: hypothetical protein CSB09_04625 [Candidatus Gracilibacteria bacterium]
MNTNKMLNILILTLVFFLAFNLLMPKQEQNTTPKSGIFLFIKDGGITIPNIPQLTVFNSQTGSLKFNTCTNMSFSVGGQKIQKIQEAYPDFCHDVEIAENTNKAIDMTPLHKLFANTNYVGQYIINLNVQEEDYMVAFTVEKPGFFRSLLSTIVYDPIYNLFVAILTFLPGHSLGWAIIIITIIIRLILLVPQYKMLENTKKMQTINPKIQAIRKKYKGNQSEMGMAMMELYKKEGVNPAGSCLPLLIQMPILIGLYWVISGITDPSNFYHLYSFFHDFDPTSINTLFFGVDLTWIGGALGIAAGIILGATQWVQAYLSFRYNTPNKKTDKKSPAKKDENEMPQIDPEMMQKMMLYFFPVMLGVTAIFFPLGVSLYWFIGTLFIIGQQAYVNTMAEKKKTFGEIVEKK